MHFKTPSRNLGHKNGNKDVKSPNLISSTILIISTVALLMKNPFYVVFIIIYLLFSMIHPTYIYSVFCLSTFLLLSTSVSQYFRTNTFQSEDHPKSTGPKWRECKHTLSRMGKAISFNICRRLDRCWPSLEAKIYISSETFSHLIPTDQIS